jgi:hypothetical protein
MSRVADVGAREVSKLVPAINVHRITSSVCWQFVIHPYYAIRSRNDLCITINFSTALCQNLPWVVLSTFYGSRCRHSSNRRLVPDGFSASSDADLRITNSGIKCRCYVQVISNKGKVLVVVGGIISWSAYKSIAARRAREGHELTSQEKPQALRGERSRNLAEEKQALEKMQKNSTVQ